jgi:hypothetical protein
VSLNPTKLEIDSIVAILEDPKWEEPDDNGDVPSVEDVAKAILKAVDEARTERTTYIAVMVFSKQFAVAIGPYAGATSARNAVEKYPPASLAKQIAVVPLTSQEGVEKKLREVG